MTHHSRPLLFAIACALPALLPAADTTSEIKSLLNHQVDDWNRGDLPHFVSHYAATATIVGKNIETRSRAQILEHYRTSYGSGAKMGKLTFTNLAVQPLDDRVAIATANWHVERDSAAGGPVGGVFSLALQLANGKWQIVLDHTN
jgi:ketosteroid isomerase-like protein